MRAVLACLAIAVLGMDAEAAVRVYRPSDPSQVVVQLGSSAAESELAKLRAAGDSGDAQSLLRYVDALIAVSARSGDERYYGYAEEALNTARAGSSDPVLTLKRAQLLQHRHEFKAAEQLLGSVLAMSPRDRDARLMRAQVRLHLHMPREAMQDCAALTRVVDMLTSSTCIAQARAALGDLQRAYDFLVRVLETQQGDDATRGWSAGVAAEMAARRGDSASAARWYEEAFERDPTSHYVRITYADWLLARGRDAEALRVASRGASLPDRARRVLAARDPNSAESQRLQLAWQEAAARGERAHLRDQAHFELWLLHDAAKAHAAALENFAERREADDALLLAETAAATHDRNAMQTLNAWRAERHYQDVRLDAFMGALQ